MVNKLFIVIGGLFVLGVFGFALLFGVFNITGFAVFEQTGSDFDEGTYSNTEFNGSAVVLSGSNLSGTYTSKVFDAGIDANWNNLTVQISKPFSGNNFMTSAVYSGTNITGVFTKDGNFDTVNMKNENKRFYLNFSKELIDNSVFKFYAKKNKGAAIGIYSQSDTLGSNPLGIFTITSTTGDWYNVTLDIETPTKAIWIGEGTESGTDPKDDFDYIESEIPETNLSFQVKNCSLANCSDGIWQSLDLNNLNLQGRYFQYRVLFESPDTSITPSLKSIIIDYDVLNTAPLIEILSPINTDYNYNQEINLNYSVIDDDLEACWYVLNSEPKVILSNCENTTFYAPVGNNVLSVYANDSVGLIGSDNVSFNSVNTPPIITLIEPYEGIIYGYNESIALKFLIQDNGGDLESCWYNIDGGENILIPNCQNTSFSVAGNEEYTLTIYANDSLGEQDSDSATFQVSLGAPTIIVNSPQDNKYINENENEFIYTAFDIDLDSCELWGDFTGTFKKNQTEKVISGEENRFNLVLSDKEYKWKIVCNDTEGNYTSSPNRTIYIDTTLPQITITEPKGKKTSRTNIPLTFSISDASPVTCIYNVYRGANLEISNNSISCSGTKSFNVTVDADFVLNLYVTDLANNFNSASSSFSVDTSSLSQPPQTSPSGGGSGGSSVGIISPSPASNLKIQPINIILLPNTERSLQVLVKNEGRTAANRCKITTNNPRYIEPRDIKNIGIGEIVEFNFILKAIDKDVRNLKLKIECLENVSAEIPLDITLLESKLDVSIKEISIQKNNLIIKYEIKTNLDSTEEIYFRILDSSNNLIKEVSEKISLKADKINEGEIAVLLLENEEEMLKISITDETKEFIFIEESFIIRRGRSLFVGYTFMEIIGKFSYIGIILIVFLVLVVLIIRRMRELRKMNK